MMLLSSGRPRAAFFIALALCAAVLHSPVSAKPPGGPQGAGSGGAGAGAAGSSAATGPSAPTSTILSAFKPFYIVADGAEPNFNTYATELIARQLSGDFTPAENVYFVAATGWTQDTLNTACQNDPNAVGGLVVKFTSFEVESNWLIYNTESQHVTPTVFLVACHGPLAYLATPPLNIFTIKSRNQVTYPIAPITALGAVFTYKGGTGAIQTNTDTLVLVTAASALSGNFGYFNPGHEALTAAEQVMLDASAFTGFACYGKFVGRYANPNASAASDPTAFVNAPSDLQRTPVEQRLLTVFQNLRSAQTQHFPSLLGPYATPPPQGTPPLPVGTPQPSSNTAHDPPPNASKAPLDSICDSLGAPQIKDESDI